MRINGPRVPDRRFSTTAGGDAPPPPGPAPSPPPSRGISELLFRLLETEVVEVEVELLLLLLLQVLLLLSVAIAGWCRPVGVVVVTISLLLRRRADNEPVDSLDLENPRKCYSIEKKKRRNFYSTKMCDFKEL